ncbi:hypothetical protein [Citrobacter pasteurii]|nr:hypothetical protein [Citrobacter pasteurii]
MQMTDKNTIKFAWVERGAKHLMLRPFAAIKKPQTCLSRVLQIQ